MDRVSCAVLLVTFGLACQHVAAIEVKKFAKDYLKSRGSTNHFDRLNTLVTSPLGLPSRDDDTVFKLIEDYLAKNESKKEKNELLTKYAERFVQLKRKQGDEACDAENVKATHELYHKLREGLEEPITESGPSNINRRKLLKVFKNVGLKNARFCLAKYAKDWADMTIRVDWLVDDPHKQDEITENLWIFQDNLSTDRCYTRIQTKCKTLAKFECALRYTVDDKLNALTGNGIKGLRLTLEAIQRLRDPSKYSLVEVDKQTDLYRAKSAWDIVKTEIQPFLEEPCVALLNNKRVMSTLKSIEYFGRLFGLSDDLFDKWDANTDQMVRWADRALLCARLKASGRYDIAEELVGFARPDEYNNGRVNKEEAWQRVLDILERRERDRAIKA